MISLKIIIFLQNEQDLSCVEIVSQPHKTLKEIGNFLYNQQKINFNDFVFTNKPVKVPDIVSQKTKNKLSHISNKHQQKQNEVVFRIFTNEQILQSILRNLKKQKETHYLLLMYNKKELDSILRKSQTLITSKQVMNAEQQSLPQQDVMKKANECQIC